MQYLRRALVLTLVICVLGTQLAVASPLDSGPADSGDGYVWVDPSREEETESAFLRRWEARIGALENQQMRPNADDVSVQSVVGETRIVMHYGNANTIYWDDHTGGLISVIGTTMLTIFSYWGKLAGTIIAATVTVAGIPQDDEQYCEAEMGHSYRYIEKRAQVFTSNLIWETYYSSRSREWYAHERGLYTDAMGYTHQRSFDYTDSPINVNWAPHYSDDSWLLGEALERYNLGQSPGYEDWTTTTGDPIDYNSINIGD
ncbi:MAG: hypothetical protein AB1331_08340 [Bacillota bacterium]